MTTYRLFGTGLPWEGKAISRQAAQGLLRSFSRCPWMVVQPCTFRARSTRVWAFVPRRIDVSGLFNLVAEHTREAAL